MCKFCDSDAYLCLLFTEEMTWSLQKDRVHISDPAYFITQAFVMANTSVSSSSRNQKCRFGVREVRVMNNAWVRTSSWAFQVSKLHRTLRTSDFSQMWDGGHKLSNRLLYRVRHWWRTRLPSYQWAADSAELAANMRGWGMVEELVGGATMVRSCSKWLSTSLRVLDHIPSRNSKFAKKIGANWERWDDQ